MLSNGKQELQRWLVQQKSGKWISAKRAHQKVGEVIDGWVKCRNPRTGKFYFMKIDDDYYNDDEY